MGIGNGNLPGRGVDADEFIEQLWPSEREDHADAAAHRLTHERYLLHPHLKEREVRVDILVSFSRNTL